MQVFNLEEAQDFFMSNSSGSVICVNSDNEEQEVLCYPDAKKFFNNNIN